MKVAEAILEQLGGRRFCAMTGAKNFTSSDDSLNFRLPSNFATDGINAIRVTLDPSDTYTLKCWKVRGVKATEVAEASRVYADSLRETFTRLTGLDCTLGRA